MGLSEENEPLPRGQRAISKILRWYVDHPGITRTPPRIDVRTWRLLVDGLVENILELGWEEFLELPHVVIVSDFHCVEGWSVRDCSWEGVRFKTLMEMAKPKEGGRYAWFECSDGYTTSLAVGELSRDGVVLAHRLNGEELPFELGGPVRLVVPDKYCYKSPMWITRIAFIDVKRLGFWERRGYSDTADVWKNDRRAF